MSPSARFALASLLALGCSAPGARPDAGDVLPDVRIPIDVPIASDVPTPPTDGPTPDVPAFDGGVLPALPVLTVGTPDDPERDAARFECTPRGPVASLPTLLPFELVSFGTTDFAADTEIQAFWDGELLDTCDARCSSATTDAAGHATLTVPGGAWIAVRTLAHTGATSATSFVETRAVHVETPRSAVVRAQATTVSVATMDLLAAAYGFAPVAGSAVVLGDLHDCEEDAVRGALLRVFAADGNEILDSDVAGAPHLRYFDGRRNPDGDRTYTQVDGLFVAANLPITGAEGELRIEAWGVRATGAAPVRLACETIVMTPDGVGFVPLAPYREDYPPGHPCAPPTP